MVDLEERRIVVHRDPGTTGFDTVDTITDGVVRALRHPAVQVDVRDLLSAD